MSAKGAYRSLTAQELVGIAQLVHNQQISQVDGSTPGHRVYGRAPRLPVPSTEGAEFGNINQPSFGVAAPETRTMLIVKAIAECRIRWLEADSKAKCRKALSHKDRSVRDQDIFVGQSVYFYHQPNKGSPSWKGPALVIGRYNTMALIDYNCAVIKVAIEALRPTWGAYGVNDVDGQLQLHTGGGEQSLKMAPCAKTLQFLTRLKMMKEKSKPMVLDEDTGEFKEDKWPSEKRAIEEESRNPYLYRANLKRPLGAASAASALEGEVTHKSDGAQGKGCELPKKKEPKEPTPDRHAQQREPKRKYLEMQDLILKANKPKPTIQEKIKDALQSQAADAKAEEREPAEAAALDELSQKADQDAPSESGAESVPTETSNTSSEEDVVNLCDESQAKNQWQWMQQPGWQRTTKNTENS